MRCLVTGAYGFIGRQIVAALVREEWSVTGAGRDLDLAHRLIPGIDWVACDFNRDIDAAHWRPRLDGVDAVVNCVGVLQGSARDDIDRIHSQATIALFQASAAAGVKRVVHVSAVSAEAGMESAYARSKASADAALAAVDVNWVIVKPSLVIGQGSYGGTSLMRGLAGLPFILPLPGQARARFQPIAVDDLARSIVRLAGGDTPSRTVLHAAGPETVSVRNILVTYRTWLGFGKAREIEVPPMLLRVLLRFGDLAGWLGYDTAARTTSFTQMQYDTPVDGADFARLCGAPVKGFTQTLASWPATLQDRLHARSYFAVPLLQVAIAVFWMLTGVITLLPAGFAPAVALVADAGFSHSFATSLVTAGGLADIVLGALFLLPGWVRRAGAAQLLLSTVYLIGLSIVAPQLWADPFGPLLKVVPIMAATLVVMAFQEER